MSKKSKSRIYPEKSMDATRMCLEKSRTQLGPNIIYGRNSNAPLYLYNLEPYFTVI